MITHKITKYDYNSDHVLQLVDALRVYMSCAASCASAFVVHETIINLTAYFVNNLRDMSLLFLMKCLFVFVVFLI